MHVAILSGNKKPNSMILMDNSALIGQQNTVIWWLWVDSNHRPQHYECCALTG